MQMAFGNSLKDWRQRRRMSQLELGLSANVSARHISFLETGRSKPSRGMVLRLCDELAIPKFSRNQMLTAAGLAPAYGDRGLSEKAMAPVRDAVDWLLDHHEPYPAIALNRHWVIVRMNRIANMLLSGLGVADGDNLLNAVIEDDRMRDAIDNLDEVLHHVLQRLRTESAHLGGDAILDDMIARLAKQCVESTTHADGILPPFVPTHYRSGDTRFSLFSTFTQFGTAEDITLSELRIEMMFPADDATRTRLEAMAAG